MLEIYTDGSSMENGSENSRGGIGIVFVKENKEIKTHQEFFRRTTNNRSELLAIIKAILIYLKEFNEERATLYSDSEYCIKGINEWVGGWRKRNYSRTKKESLLLNSDIWFVMYELKQLTPNITFKWVKGHNGNIWNEKADQLAKPSVLL